MAGTVMIVSASGAMTEMVAWALEGSPYSLVRSANSIDAFGKLEQKKVDCIMIDLFMPELGGEVLHQVRTTPQAKAIPLILLSNEEVPEREDQIDARFARVGVPFNRESLLSILHLLIV